MVSQAGVPPDIKNYFGGSSIEERFGNTALDGLRLDFW
jgi:hypothetical protein